MSCFLSRTLRTSTDLNNSGQGRQRIVVAAQLVYYITVASYHVSGD